MNFIKNVFFIFFSLFFLFLNIQTAECQNKTIIGTIFNENNQQILSNVKIGIKNTNISTISNYAGKFLITLPDSITDFEFQTFFDLKIKEIKKLSDLEYEIITFEDDNYDPYDLSINELIDIEIITANKQNEKISKIPASVIVLTRLDIERAGYSTLEEIFQNIPGFYYANQQTFLGPTIGVRGYMTANPSNIMILINGVPQMNDIFNSFTFAQSPIAVESIDRIEFVKGPMSVIYGSNAFFGAINIITNNSSDENSSNSIVSVSTGHPFIGKAVISSRGNYNDISYSLNANIFDDIGIDYKFNKMVKNFDEKYATLGFTSPEANSKDFFTNNQRSFYFSGKFKNILFDLSFAKAEYGHTILTLFYKPAMMVSTFGNASIGYIFNLNHSFSFQSKISYNRYDLYLGDNYFSTDTNGFGYESDIYSYGQYWSEKFSTEITSFYKPNNKFNITTSFSYGIIPDAGDKTDAPFGGLSVNLINRAGGLKDGEDVRLFSLYSQLDYQLLDKLRIVAGVRAEQISEFEMILYRAAYTPLFQKFEYKYDYNDIYFVPRGAVIYELNHNHFFKAMYGEAHKLPDIWQIRNNMVSPTKNTLKPEIISTIEINYIANITKWANINFSIFKNDFKELIQRTIIFDASVNPPLYQSYFTNTGKMTTLGSELGANIQITRKLKTELNLTYQETKNINQELDTIAVEFSPKMLVNSKIIWQINDNICFTILANYVDKMYAQWDSQLKNSSSTSYEPIGRYGDMVPEYWILSSNIRIENVFRPKNKLNQSFYINIKANNILNQEIKYATTSLSKWADKGILGKGRNFVFSIGFKF